MYSKITPTQLFDVPQSLKLWRVDDFHAKRMNFNVTMDAIIKNLSDNNIDLIQHNVRA